MAGTPRNEKDPVCCPRGAQATEKTPGFNSTVSDGSRTLGKALLFAESPFLFLENGGGAPSIKDSHCFFLPSTWTKIASDQLWGLGGSVYNLGCRTGYIT